MLALLTFGWSRQRALGERFATSHQASQHVLGGSAIAGSHQALMVALRACGKSLSERIRQQMVLLLQTQSNWLFLGRATFAVDGSQFAVPRTKRNLAHFAAAGRKSKAAYKKDADHGKAKTTQIAVSLSRWFVRRFSCGESNQTESSVSAQGHHGARPR